MKKFAKFFSFIFLFSLILPKGLYAQQKTSKSKSKEKLYEKGDIENQVIVRNATLINTEHLEFSPAFYQNGIVYVTSRRNSGSVDPKTGETFFELYYAELDIDGMPLSPQEFSINLNSQVHEGPVSFNRSWDKLYFTRNNMSKDGTRADGKGISRLKIYEATKGKYDWENVRELPFNSDNYSVMHPALSPDGHRLYFASDMPGGYGGFDLYMSEKVGDAWSLPINLGPDINTAGNEVFPFMHESGILFFASNGHKGLGGLDIFMVNMRGSQWSKATNLGEPFNSSRDDFGLILNPEGNLGFFSSDRAGGYGKDDIYQLRIKGLSYFNRNLELPAKIVSFNSLTNERVPGVQIYLFERDKDGYLRDNEAYEVEVKPSLGNPEQLELTLSRKSATRLGEPSLVTDANGEAISQLQAEKDYFIIAVRSGYKTREFQYSTVGEQGAQTIRIPLEESRCVSLTGQIRSTDKGEPISYAKVRLLNETSNEEQYIRTNIDGIFERCLPLNCQYKITAEKDGFASEATTLSTVGLNPDEPTPLQVELQLRAVEEDPFAAPLHTGSVIVLENIYYDFDKSAIRSGAARELDALATLMKQYPEMRIELSSHTDSRGSTKYNLELSKKRAASAKQYLVSKGIAADRITARGMGESQIRNRCVDGVKCSEEEHQYNRRTEVRIIHLGAPLKIQYAEGDPFKNK